MFDVGFWEISLIAIVALVVVGPERFPAMARSAGQWIGRARTVVRDLKYQLEHEAQLSELEEIGEEIRNSATPITAGDLNRQRETAESTSSDVAKQE